MRHKKAIFLGSIVIMTAAMVIFAQEPVRRAAQSHRHADGHLQQMKYHQLTHAATQHGSAPKPAEPAPFIAPSEAKELDSETAEGAHVGETYEDFDSDPTRSALDPFDDAENISLEVDAPEATDAQPTATAPEESFELFEQEQNDTPANVTELAPADDSLQLIPASDEIEITQEDLLQLTDPVASQPDFAPEVKQADFVAGLETASELATGPQNPALVVAWNVPSTVNVGEPARCTLVVKNRGQSPTTDTRVEVAFLGSVQVVHAEPVPEQGGETLVWELGTLEPGEEQHLEIGLIPQEALELVPAAKVTSSTVAFGRINVQQPQIEIKIAAHESTIVGDAFTYALEVSNPGTGPAYGVVVETTVPEGLRHPKGSALSYAIGTLSPGESRSVQIIASAVEAGEHRIQARARTTSSNSNAPVSSTLESDAEVVVRIVQPALDVAVEGPKLRYLDRRATYTIQVTNPGSMPANNVRVAEIVPAGFRFVEATEGASYNAASRSVEWFLGQLAPGATSEVKVKLLATELGEQVHQVTAQAERGVQAEAQTVTQIDGIAALLLKVVDVEDPIEVGSETLYEIRVFNQGTKAAEDVQVIVEVPEGMEPLEASGPTTFETKDRQIQFAPIPRLGPQADAVYRVTVKGSKPGDLRFRAWLGASELSTPVLQEESTRVYGD